MIGVVRGEERQPVAILNNKFRIKLAINFLNAIIRFLAISITKNSNEAHITTISELEMFVGRKQYLDRKIN